MQDLCRTQSKEEKEISVSRMTKYKVQHDRPHCVGTFNCTALCPKFWKKGENGKSILKGGKESDKGWTEVEIDEKDFECNKKAAVSCPVNVIHIVNLKTDEKII